MSTVISSGNLQTALTFPFKDNKWGSKLAVAGLFVLLSPVIPLIPVLLLLGYSARVMRRITNGDGQPALPEWNDWEKLLTDGLRLLGINMIYMIPGIALIALGYLLMLIPAITGAMESSRMTWQPLGMMAGLWFFMGLGILYTLVVKFALGAIQVHVIAKERFVAGFEFGAWWRILKANLGGFLLAFVIMVGLAQLLAGAIALTWLTICLICLVPFLAILIGIYIQLVSAALYALAYREAETRLNPPAEG
jgi:hypothetical protein